MFWQYLSSRTGVAVFCVGIGVAAGLPARAQDTRQVTEPNIPPACAQLTAQLWTNKTNNNIGEADEGKLDTERIQAALDKCGRGKAVELKIGGANNAFLTGPLEMRTGVTLLIDEGVTLFGSRDAALYDMKGEGAAPGLCGTIATGAPPPVFRAPERPGPARGGCRPLISVMNAKDVGIMGKGVIDGRGYAKILGKDYSWWELARKAEPKNERYFNPRMIVANHADGLAMYQITVYNSTNFHVSVNRTNGFTACGVHLVTQPTKAHDGRHTGELRPASAPKVAGAHTRIDN